MTAVRRPRAVLLDVDGTLYWQTPLRALMAAELLTLPLDGPLLVPRRLRALKAYRKAQEQLRHRPGSGLSGGQISAAVLASGLPVEEVESLVGEWMLRRPLKYLRVCRAKGLMEFLTEAERRGVRVGVLSDYPAEAKLRALGLEGRFFPVLCATDWEIDAFKPSPRGYLRACEIWGLPPSDVLFVGDRADVDATGAKAAGMPCVIIGPSGARQGNAGDYAVFPSFERLSRVFDGH